MHPLKTILLAALSSALVFVPGTAWAHHSYGMFDMTKCLKLSGTVRQFKFTYPHSWVWVDVPGANGAATTWAFETTDPASLAVRGWRPNTLKKGDKVSVTYSRLRDGRPGGSLRAIIGPAGKPLPVESVPCPAGG